MTKIPTNIHLYTLGTPNGVKVSMLLEELNLDYKVTTIDISTNVQKEPWFLEINPNGRIPALTDIHTDGKSINLWESGSIMQYLIDRYDTEHKVSYPHGSREYWEVNNWVMWQMGGLGPMQGQANHFARYAPEKIPYGITRYITETYRLYGILDKQLSKSTSGFIVGNRLTIADIICVGWVGAHAWPGLSLDKYPYLAKWLEKMEAREGIKRGWDVPTPRKRISAMSEEEKEKQAEAARKWIQQATKDELQK